MTFRRTAIMTAAALLVGAPIASAQHRGGGHGGGGGHAVARSGSRQSGSRSASPRSSGAAPRAGGTTERAAPATRDPHAPGTVTGTAVPRSYGAVIRPYGYVGTGVFRGPITFYRPYYAFRPRFSLGFGLWAGFPIAYPYYWGYYDPFYAPYYAYPDPYAPYPYPPYSNAYPAPPYQPPSGSIGAQTPNRTAMGGVSFEITPSTAEVWVDGQAAGTVDMFTPRSQPLGLTAGRHRIEIRAPGYKNMDFDVDIVAGQVIPYQGALER